MSPAAENLADVLIVGAGMAGLSAASELRQRGHRPLVIDKGRGVGGRMTSRRIGRATFDHGAQFMTARDPRFAAAMDDWRRADVVEEWHDHPADRPDGERRWRGMPAMTAVARHLAGAVAPVLETRVVSLSLTPAGWSAALDGGRSVMAGAVVLTPPVPQSLALLDAGGFELPPAMSARLERLEYERCLAVMAVLDGPSLVPPPGGLASAGGAVAWMADNQMKGVSAVPAVTLHATAAFSLEHWDEDRASCGRELLQIARPWLGSQVTEFQVHGWRYSRPTRIDESACLILSQSPPLVMAGDAFGGPRVEGAALSGWAAADALQTMVPCPPAGRR